MAQQNTEHRENVTSMERWYKPREVVARLGVSLAQLSRWRVERRGPRFKKLGDSPQSKVVYSESDIAEFQNSTRTIETEQYEAEKAS